jgi:hypothetical protein
MVSKVDWTVDSCIIFQNNTTVATSRLSIFHRFSLCHMFQWGSGRIRTKWPQNVKKFLTKSTVDYVADPRSCNS